MTGFASAEGRYEAFSWSWELRSVNGRGLDLRLRVPDWVDGLEVALRKRLSDALGRGSVTLNLRLSRDAASAHLALNEDMLETVLTALSRVEDAAISRGHTFAPATAADVLAMRGMLDASQADQDAETIILLRKALLRDFEDVLVAFKEARASEGRALHTLLAGHLDQIAELTRQASEADKARRPAAEAAFRKALQRVISTGEDVPEERIAQELAVLAVKADVTEELGRLQAHIEAARALLLRDDPVGRRFDFLMQEFNREANTLCSKSQDKDLTAVGLELKTTIDQLREQVQNVE